jgi:hypothetical protein
MKYGFPEAAWNAGKEEGRRAMIEKARRKSTIPYSELVDRHIKSIRLDPHGGPLRFAR